MEGRERNDKLSIIVEVTTSNDFLRNPRGCDSRSNDDYSLTHGITLFHEHQFSDCSDEKLTLLMKLGLSACWALACCQFKICIHSSCVTMVCTLVSDEEEGKALMNELGSSMLPIQY